MSIIRLSTSDERTEPFSLLDPRFRYVRSGDTDLAARFREVFTLNTIRRRQREEKLRPPQAD